MSRQELAERCNGTGLREQVLGRLLEHALVHEKDFSSRRMILGPALGFDPKSERFTGELADQANLLAKDDYRAPFVVPDEV